MVAADYINTNRYMGERKASICYSVLNVKINIKQYFRQQMIWGLNWIMCKSGPQNTANGRKIWIKYDLNSLFVVKEWFEVVLKKDLLTYLFRSHEGPEDLYCSNKWRHNMAETTSRTQNNTFSTKHWKLKYVTMMYLY